MLTEQVFSQLSYLLSPTPALLMRPGSGSPLHRYPHHDPLHPSGFVTPAPCGILPLPVQGLLHSSAGCPDRAKLQPTQDPHHGCALWLNPSSHLSFPQLTSFDPSGFRWMSPPQSSCGRQPLWESLPLPALVFLYDCTSVSSAASTALFINVLMMSRQPFWPQGNDQEVS